MRTSHTKTWHPRSAVQSGLAIGWAKAIPRAAALALLVTLSVSAVPAVGASGGSGRAEPADHAAADDSGSEYPFRGVELGEFRVRAYYPVEARKSTVEFTVYAKVARGNATDFRRLLKHRRQKARDQIITVTRMVSLADYDDPELVSFRRRILLRLRRALPELAIEDVYISDFQLTVQSVAP